MAAVPANSMPNKTSAAPTAAAEVPNFKRELLATLPSLRAFAVSLSSRFRFSWFASAFFAPRPTLVSP